MLISSVTIAILAVLIILFGSPLFAVLGFEYSALMALALSFVCGIMAVKSAKGTSRKAIGRNAGQSLMLSAIPFSISVLSLPFLPNCAFGDGVLFYLEIAIPSAILGGIFGLACGWLTKSRRSAVLLFIAFWVVSLVLSLLPGYYNPQIYTYGWQYGFFPGIVWDESLELTNAYLAFRLENIVWAVFAVSLAYEMKLRRSPNMWFVIPGILTVALFGFHDALHITTSHGALEAQLSKILNVDSTCTVYYAQNSLTEDEREKLSRDVEWYLHDVEHRFALSANHPPIAIYLYPSSDKMFDLIGTRTASLAKPWLSEVHIAKENLESLKHELTHVLLREKGVFPFYASWSTGVTEGAAMSVEPEFDGIYTLDEHAARILQMHYATGVQEIMSFTGFAANASEKSYVLAGSFSRYLLSQYGSGPFDRVYASLDWQKEYGKRLDTLELEWKRWLTPMMTPMDADDSGHFNYYYNRSSIIYELCLRKIGKLEREGSKALQAHRYTEAEKNYRKAIEEGAGISALFGIESADIGSGHWQAALAALDTTRTPAIKKQIAALDLQRADLHFLAGDTDLADHLYSHAESIKLNWQRFLLSYARQILMHSEEHSQWERYLHAVFTGKNLTSQSLDSMLGIMLNHASFASQDTFDRVPFAIRILMVDHRIRVGELVRATMLATLQPTQTSEPLSENDSLALFLFGKEVSVLGIRTMGERFANICPLKYERAAKEITDEINAEQQYLQQHRSAPARGTNPK